MGVHIGVEIIFFIKAILFGLAAIILIPKEQYKKFLVYSLFFGGFGEILIILVFSLLLGCFHYLNMGYFNILNITPFWSPVAWIFVMMLFLYNLPIKRSFFYLYIIAFGIFGYFVGLVLENFHLYKFVGAYKYFLPLLLICWFYAAARLYMKAEKLKLQ